MVLCVSKSSFSEDVEHISFPVEADKVRNTMLALEEFGDYAPANVIRGEGFAQILTGYIKRDDLFSKTGVQKLNQLSGIVDGMDSAAQELFSGALHTESINSLDDVLRVAASLEQYEFIEGVTSNKELGGWLVEHGLAGVDFPKEVWPYLDYAGIGAEYYSDYGGAYTPHGYVKRRESEVEQAQAAETKPTFALMLASATGTVRLALPAADTELERAKQALGLDNLELAVIQNTEIEYPWANLLPLDNVTLKDADLLAQYVRQMSNSELRLFGAALEAEEPDTFSAAASIAGDLNDYELVDSTQEEYGREALRYAGVGDEILDMLDGFTDFDALGRFEMEQDGVLDTGYGQIKRLSSPFPQQNMGQAMY